MEGRAPLKVLLAMGLLSAVVLVVQISSTRLLSATVLYHAAFEDIVGCSQHHDRWRLFLHFSSVEHAGSLGSHRCSQPDQNRHYHREHRARTHGYCLLAIVFSLLGAMVWRYFA